MALDYALGREFKESTAFDSLVNLLEKDDFVTLGNLYCGKDSYSYSIQGESIEYVSCYPESRDLYARIKTFDNKIIECRVYNHNNNVKIRRRDYSYYPVKEDDHIYTFDYHTGRSSVSSIIRDVYNPNKDNEFAKVLKYQKATFEWDGSLAEYEDTIKTFDSDYKKKKY